MRGKIGDVGGGALSLVFFARRCFLSARSKLSLLFSLDFFSSSARSPLNFPDQSPVSSAGFEVFGAGLTGHRKATSKILQRKRRLFGPKSVDAASSSLGGFVYFGEGEFVRVFAKNSVEIRLFGRIESPVKYR